MHLKGVEAGLWVQKQDLLLWIELVLLFIALPVSLALNPLVELSILLVVISLIYVVYICKSQFCDNSFLTMWKQIRSGFKPQLTQLWPRVTIKFIVFALFATAFVYIQMRSSLFVVLLKDPLLWLLVCLFYCLVSVLSQEALYRSFFFSRYERLIASPSLFILFNAALFCVAHLMFHNLIVLLLTFVGGLLFAYTYQKTRSYWLVCAEHSFYGLWIFTLGLGEILAFPAARAITQGVG
jgi:membrane protease YdiL (CAAX protease family)